ncbi:MAG: beta-1,6-N-acetylglucosaminyltransferase, partial [Pseudomonadota bacterium]
MRLLFVILAHDRPEAAAALAAALTDGATDARALIHFDARADAASFERLAAAAAGQDRVRLAAERVATPWGRWGLVQATLDALEEARGWGRAGDGWTPDRALLLSGACLPCRPVRALERFLRAHPRREFIEAGPASWIKGGIKEERYRHWFPFDFRAQRRLHHLFHQAQRILGVERRVPDGLIPRFGSQWWGLTWETCLKLLAHRVAHPDHMRWFRWSWIPDEFAIQTLVAA